MRITVRAGRIDQVRGGIQAFGAFEGDRRPQRLLPASAGANRSLAALIAGAGFRGAANETAFLPNGKQWVLVVGLGKPRICPLRRCDRWPAPRRAPCAHAATPR